MADVAEPTVLAQRADAEVMSSFLGLLLDGEEGDLEGTRWAADLALLKERELVRQTRSGRIVPTGKGRALWNHARAVRARMALAERPSAGRPFFVVFARDGAGLAFTEWDRAVLHVRMLTARGLLSIDSVSGPEDLVECWPASHLPPPVARRAEERGCADLDGGGGTR